MGVDWSTPGSAASGIWDWFGGHVSDNIVSRIVEEKLGLNPSLEDEVTVEVTGQPGVTKQQMYFLALAAANGIVRRFADLFQVAMPTYGMLMIEYDAADHWVRCTIRYRWSMGSVNAGTLAGVTVSDLFERMAVYRGPQCEVVGGAFDFLATGDVVGGNPGIPVSSASPGAPDLPLRGDTILTSCPRVVQPTPGPITQNPVPSQPVFVVGPEIDSPNPKPPGDSRSRGAVVTGQTGGFPKQPPGPTPIAQKAKCCEKFLSLIPLVYAALSEPATNSKMTYPLPTSGPTGG